MGRDPTDPVLMGQMLGLPVSGLGRVLSTTGLVSIIASHRGTESRGKHA